MKFRALILYFLFNSSGSVMFAQINVKPPNNTDRLVNINQWSINDYIWSHANHKTKKNDKPVLNFDAIDNWEQVGDDRDVTLSPDGRYVGYSITQGLNRHKSVIIQSASTSWKKEFPGSNPGYFSIDSKMYIFSNKDTIFFLRLGDSEPEIETNVASFNRGLNPKNEWLAWQQNNKTRTVILRNLLTGKIERFDNAVSYSFDKSSEWFSVQLDNESKELILFNLPSGLRQRFLLVSSYSFSEDGKALLLKISQSGGKTALRYVNLFSKRSSDIWVANTSSELLKSYCIDKSGRQAVFVVEDTLHFVNNSLWYWKDGMDNAEIKIDDHSEGIETNLHIQTAAFSYADNSYITFILKEGQNRIKAKTNAIALDLWSYKDTVLQAAQPDLIKKTKFYNGIMSPNQNGITFIEDEFEKIKAELPNGYIIIGKIGREVNGDRFWERNYNIDSNWLLSLKDKSSTFLMTESPSSDFISSAKFSFSPNGHYLVYFDAKNKCNYFSIALHTGKLTNISSDIPSWQLGIENGYELTGERPRYGMGILGWLQDDKGLLVYDNYDIWQLDLSGKKAPFSVTNGYGRSHRIVFYLRGEGPIREYIGWAPIFSDNETIILQAFNENNMQSGIYKKVLGEPGNPKQLFMGPCRLEVLAASAWGDKLRLGKTFMDDRSSSFIVKRQSNIDAPNYYITHDFKIYEKITNFHKQQQYNWFSSELRSFRQLDGTLSRGILFKPENLDPAKKYPVIISFYVNLSDMLYQFPTPAYVNRPSIWDTPAWFVSHGYCVFLPDIYFVKGKWGPSTINTIVGASNYLSTLSFVDAKHIAACGHSNSGRFGHYLLTHSKQFAAMSIGSGTTNILSNAFYIEDGKSMLEWAEVSAVGTGLGSLWQNKSSWLDQASLLSADKVTTPVLMYHSKSHDNPIDEAIAMFTALRRLEKKAWWLQYDNGGHSLGLQKDLRDFTIRYTQFYDHYLKGAPAPRWMTQGIPYKLKGIESRYELDPSGTCDLPGKKECNICAAWNKQYKRNPAMFEKPIAEWKLDDDIQKELDKKETERYKKNMVGEAQHINENNAKLRQKVKE